jgi:hypothetical protein
VLVKFGFLPKVGGGVLGIELIDDTMDPVLPPSRLHVHLSHVTSARMMSPILPPEAR